MKMHTLLDLRGNIPSFIHISAGKPHDVHVLDMLLPEAGGAEDRPEHREKSPFGKTDDGYADDPYWRWA